jgi:hypothetical protein
LSSHRRIACAFTAAASSASTIRVASASVRTFCAAHRQDRLARRLWHRGSMRARRELMLGSYRFRLGAAPLLAWPRFLATACDPSASGACEDR